MKTPVLTFGCALVLAAVHAGGQLYSVSFGGRPLRLETARISAMPFNRIWNGTQRPPEQTRPAAFVQLDVAAPGELCVTFDGEAPAAEVYPLSESARAVRAGRAWRVPLDGPGYRVLDFGADVPPLHVFANEPFAYRHVPGEIYFGPGEHDAGVIAPTNGQTVCLDAGAVVRGALFVDRATNVTVVGRGILDCSGFTRADPRAKAFRRGRGLPEEDTEFACHACVVYASRNVRLSGFVIRDTPFWALIVRNGSRDVVIDGVKVIGQWRYNSDGIDVAASEDVTVRNSFMRTFDDCAVVLDGYLDPDANWSRNVRFERCFMWCDWGANVKVWGGAKEGGVTDVCFRSNVLAHVSGRACAINGAYSSPSTLVRNIAVEDLEIDVRARARERIQRSDAETYAGGVQNELELFSVAVPWPRKNLGNQHSRPLTESEAAGCSKRFENIAFRRFAVFGDQTEFTGEVKVDGPNQSVTGVTTEGLPPLRMKAW